MKPSLFVILRSRFEALPEYSCSTPTAVHVGKRWRRNFNAFRDPKLYPPDWMIYEIREVPGDFDRVRVEAFEVQILEDGQ